MEAGVPLTLMVKENKVNSSTKESEEDADDEDEDVSSLYTDQDGASFWFIEEKLSPSDMSFLTFMAWRNGRMLGVFLKGDGVVLLGTRNLVEFGGRVRVWCCHWCTLMRLSLLLWVSVIITWCSIEAITVGYLPYMMVRMGEERCSNSSLFRCLEGLPLVFLGSVNASLRSNGQHHRPASEMKVQIGITMEVVARLLDVVQNLYLGSSGVKTAESITLLADRGLGSSQYRPVVGWIFLVSILLSRVEKLFKISSV